MGKKDKDKPKKKGKQDGDKGSPFAIPRPPPWPLPGWLGAAFGSRPKSPAEPAPAAPPVASPPVGPATAPTPPSAAAPPGEPDEIRAAPAAAIDEQLDEQIEEEDMESADLPAEPDVETTDMADIADIAPVGTAEIHEDAPAAASPSIEPAAAAQPTVDELNQQIRDLEARLDRMLDEQRAGSAAGAPRSSSEAVAPKRPVDLDWSEHGGPPAASSAHDLLTSEFYLRQWGRAGMRQRAEEVDELGFDPAYEERYRPFIDFLYRYYFRVDTQGISQIPSEGRCIIVANHAGGPLPYDGLMLRAAVRREHDSKRDLRWLAEDFVFYLPFVGASLNRLGAVRACQENAERLLSRERLVAVFPEGAKGIGKLFGERYRLQRFGRGGFIRLCLRTGTPIVPCAIVGAEEANPTVYRLESLAKLVGLPYLPVTPTFPALGPLGLLPAPTKWKIRFGEPIRLTTYGPEAAEDDLLVTRLAEGVRTVIQEMLSGMLASRRSIWLG